MASGFTEMFFIYIATLSMNRPPDIMGLVCGAWRKRSEWSADDT